MAKTKTAMVAGVVFLLLIVAGVVTGVIVSFKTEQTAVNDEWRRVPAIELDLTDVSLDEIRERGKDEKYEGNSLSVSDGAGEVSYDGVEVKKRGNSTQLTPKIPLRVKFPRKVSLLGMEKGKKWVLLSNFLDDSQLRNDVALYVAGMLDPEGAISGEFAELTVDGEEQGLYYVTPMVRISKNAVDLRDPYGVLVEVDNLHTYEAECYYSAKKMCLSLKDVVNEDYADNAMQEFVEDFDKLELAVEEKDYEAIEGLIDVESFAKYFLLSEFTVNPDAYTSSWYMYKDGADDKIHAGPGWDFDLALGNRNWVWNSTDDFYSPEADMIRELDVLGGEFVLNGEVIEKAPDGRTSKLFYELMKMPEFREVVSRVYQERMAGRKNELLAHVRQQAGRIYQLALKDDEKYREDGQGNFNEEVKYLLDWLARRYDHFEKVYGDGKFLTMPMVL